MRIKGFSTINVLVLLIIFLNPSLVQAAWQIEGVDMPHRFSLMTDRSIAISGDGIVHIAYGEDHLYHAYYDGTWHIETVDSSSDVGRFASLALDSNDKVHISYQDSINGNLKYATNASGYWITETRDNSGDITYTSIAIDSSDKIHIGYYDSANREVKYVTNTSGSWVVETVVDALSLFFFDHGGISLALDSSNKAHISYVDWSIGVHDTTYLKYATNASGSWVTETVDVGLDRYILCPSIALDSSNKAHISYADSSLGVYDTYLKYATNASGSWVIETVDSKEVLDWHNSLAIDSNDKLHINYGNRYATNASGSWVIVETVGGSCSYNSLALDANDKAHISYYSYHGGIGGIKYTTNASGAWITETVDSEGDVGKYSSLALDTSDKVHISYQDVYNRNLKYATNTSGSWVTETVDSETRIEKNISLALDSSANAHIAYLDFTNEDLKYATNASGSWITETLDSEGDVWGYVSLAVDASDKVHISYYSGYPNFNLKYVTNATGSWLAETLDANGSVTDTSLALDSSDNVHILYYDGDIRYTTNASGSWLTETIDAKGEEPITIALDTSDKVHISYQDVYNRNLKYATNTSGSWVTETVDSETQVGNNISLALDSSANAHIAYLDFTNEDLKYATNTSGSWITETLNSEGEVWGYVSLAVDASDKVYISYYDETNDDLKYVRQCHEMDLDCDGVIGDEDNCSLIPNGPMLGTCYSWSRVVSGTTCESDADCGGLPNSCSMNQEDTYPPQGNGIGDACDCEGNFDCDLDVDAEDVTAFLDDFGRNAYSDPCEAGNQCKGDFSCDGDVDAVDVTKFLEDFGRNQYNNPCPACEVGDWCQY